MECNADVVVITGAVTNDVQPLNALSRAWAELHSIGPTSVRDVQFENMLTVEVPAGKSSPSTVVKEEQWLNIPFAITQTGRGYVGAEVIPELSNMRSSDVQFDVSNKTMLLSPEQLEKSPLAYVISVKFAPSRYTGYPAEMNAP